MYVCMYNLYTHTHMCVCVCVCIYTFQAASQFNCLEMVGPGVSPQQGISGYINDPTQASILKKKVLNTVSFHSRYTRALTFENLCQGPKCALACPAGTVYRNYLWGKDAAGQGHVQIDCLADVGRLVGNI